MSTRKELTFVVLLIHILAAAWGKSPSEAYSICNRSGALHDYLIPHYEVLHSLGASRDFRLADGGVSMVSFKRFKW